MIDIVHEHSVETSLIPEKAKILDIGCRGFLFSDFFERDGHIVWPVDIDYLGIRKYVRAALSDYDGIAEIVRNSDPQATSIRKAGIVDKFTSDNFSDFIYCYTLKTLSAAIGIEFWDLIKIDIEGSEYEVIMSLDKAPAKQLTIEFHLHSGKYGLHEMDLMINKLKALGYRIAQHELSNQHGAGENYWDSLFILKS